MIEIIVLILLCIRIKKIVGPKGYSVGLWQLYTVLTWVGCEIAGFMISLLMGKDLVIMFLSGLLCAVGGYLLLQQRARKLPNRNKQQND